MVEQRSIGIAEKVDGKPGQRLCSKAALARHEFLLAQFAEFPIPESSEVQLRFIGELPRAQSLHEAINQAIPNFDAQALKQTVEITAEQEHQMLALLSLFVRVEPEVVRLQSPSTRLTRVYSFRFKDVFKVPAGTTTADALAQAYPYTAPSAIARLRSEKSELFYLMHTALRKMCDSKVTSAAHAAFHAASPGARTWLVEAVSKALESKSFATAEEVVAAVATEVLEGESDRWRDTADGKTLYGILRMFDEDDWFGMLSYLFVWPGEEGTAVAA